VSHRAGHDPRERPRSDVSLERRVGQLFHVGFDGTEPTPALESLIREYHVGGVIYFARNLHSPKQSRALTRALQRLATADGLPLFASVDEEGGVVQRLSYYTETPGAMAVAATGDPEAAATVAGIHADQLRSVGINTNLAPVLDINTNPDNPVIGGRSFGEEPDTVAAFGARYVEALQAAGVLACGKHFPGHGDTATDSHAELPVVEADADRVARVERLPFERAIDAGTGALMTAHVAFPAITGSRSEPATLSRAVLSDYLRERLGFDGLVMTDCMEMDAIVDTVGTARGAVEAVRAGADAVLVSHSPERQRRAIDAVVEAVERGEIPERRIDEAFERVVRLKASHELQPPGESANERANRAAATAIAREAVTLVRDDAGVLPFDPERPLVVLAARPTHATPVEERPTYVEDLLDAAQRCGFDVSVSTLGSEEGVGSLAQETQLLCCTVDAGHNPAQVAAVGELLETAHRPVVVGVSSPYDIRSFPAVETYLTTYDPTRPNMAALAEVLAGERAPRGRILGSLR